MYQKAAGIHMAAYVANARKVRLQQVEIGPGEELALAVVLNWAAQVTMTSNRLVIQARALRSLSKTLVLGAFAQEERSQSLQLLFDEDAKPADAQGDSSDSSKGSGNGSKSE
jgi:hypothetical protein